MSESPSIPSASELLQKTRLERELTLEQVSQKTRIPAELILAIEERRWNDLPGAPYARAFSRTLAIAYELDPEAVLAGLRNDMGLRPQPPHPQTVEVRVAKQGEESGSDRTPLILAGIIGLALVLVIAATRLVFHSDSSAARTPADSLRRDTASEIDTVHRVPTPPPPPPPPAPAPPARRTVTIALSDTSRPAFALFIRQGIPRVRKKTFSAGDTLEFDPDTSITVRNLSGRVLHLTGALRRDSLSAQFFRIYRKSDSVRVDILHEDDWDRASDAIVKRKAKKTEKTEKKPE
jgi:hypothetical protein